MLMALPSGGTLPYSFEWENGNVASERDALPPGIYTLTLTDLNGCTTSATYEMTEPAPVAASIDSLAAPLCFGDRNGYLAVAATGGQPPFTYQINGQPRPERSGFHRTRSGHLHRHGHGQPQLHGYSREQPYPHLSRSRLPSLRLHR